MVYPLYRHSGICNGVPLLILHNASDATMHLLHEDQHSFSVLLPLMRQLTLMRELITSQEYGQLKTVCVQVAKIIHTSCDWLPFGPVDDAM